MMNSVVTSLLVVILHIVLTDSLSQQGCGLGATTRRQRIFKGKQSSPGMWPWQVGIHKQGIQDDSRYGIICGGALIDPQWVVTAAHCFYLKRMSSSKIWFEADTTPLKKYKIVAGDINTQIFESFQQERYPVEMYIHPDYRHAPYYENDIALIKLNKPVTTSNLVGTVCLPDGNIDLAKPGTVGTVAGWGRTMEALRSTLLLHTTILIKTNTVCKQATNYYVNETVTFCAGDDHGGNDTCKGDSGGSLVRRVTVKGQRRWVTVGLVSWGEECGLPGKYGYYTRMYPFVTWIKDTVNTSMFSCGHPGDIPFGELVSVRKMSRFPMNFRVKYRCIPGYILKGKSGRKCKGSGKWTRAPVCVKEKRCPSIASPRNGVKRPSTSSYRYKQKIRFHCLKNHTMFGRSSMTCQIDGRWKGSPPFCLASCPDPGKPEHGSRLGDNFKHGQTVIFVCTKKPLVGVRSITCNDGEWSSNIPTCGKVSCKDPGIPKGGSRLHHSFLHGDKVSFSCKMGWKMEGEKTITCKDGQWNHKAPKCLESTCQKPKVPDNPIIVLGTLKDKYQHNKVVVYSCAPGYSIAGNPYQRCSTDGKWTSFNFKCIPKSCGDPGTPKNGRRRGYEFTFKKKVYYECDTGYERLGPEFRLCQSNQKWSDNTPTCEQCGSALGMENRKISDRNIRATSRWYRWNDAKYGRLNGGSAWCSSSSDTKPYLEIDLGKPYNITYVATQGLNSWRGKYWVSNYIVRHNIARSAFIDYREKQKQKLFDGNKDGTSLVKHKLKNPFIARKIRFQPVVYDSKSACMRVEVYGCDLPTNCVMVGSRVLGRWGDGYHGGDNYYRAYVKTIDTFTVLLEIEDEKHNSDFFKIVSKTDLALDVPNTQFNLPRGTWVLIPNNARYYTGTILQVHQHYYQVDPDNSQLRTDWIKKEDIRVPKQEQFCELVK